MGVGAAWRVYGAPQNSGPVSSWELPFSDLPAGKGPGIDLKEGKTQLLAQFEKS